MNTSELVERLENAGYAPRSYSGRGMYGERCLSVVLDEAGTSPINLILDLIYAADNMQEVMSLIDALRNPSTDSLGRGEVVYWKHIAWDDDSQPEPADLRATSSSTEISPP